MPGRKPKLIDEIEADNSRTRYTKAEIEARKENTPMIERAVLRVPPWLDDIAKREWRRIIRLARDAKVYTDLDANALGMYCQAFSRALQAYAEWEKLEERVRIENPDANLLITKDKKQNPLIQVMINAEEQCRKWGAVLGLDPVARARIGVARSKREERDSLEELLDDVTDYVNTNHV